MTIATVDLDLPDLDAEDDERAGILATAVLDRTRTYRYLLTRIWDTSLPPMVWVMLNPSTADHLADDNTIRRCMGYARREQAGGIVVVNLFALRSTDPRALKDHPDPVGPYNDIFIRRAVAGAHLVVCAWGANGSLRGRSQTVAARLARVGARPRCLGVTGQGEPFHPLYQPRDAVLGDFLPQGAVA